MRPVLALLALLSIIVTACTPAAQPAPPATDEAGAKEAAKRLKIVSTVAPIVNIIRNVGGERIDLVGIVPEGADSHTFEPAPSDARLLAEADLIVLNGLNLEVPTEKLAEANKKPQAIILKLGDNTITREEWIFDFSFPKEDGNPNPHLWMNVAHAMKYAELTHEALVKLDPANQRYYDGNLRAYLEQLEQLDRAIKAAIQTIQPQNRKLLTYHDSFAYFAPRYSMSVIGAIQPSDFSEPSPRELADLIDQLKRERVPAIFGSEVFPSKVLDQIAREAGVEFVETLRDDALPGAKDAPEHTYVGMMLDDVRTIVTVLRGNSEALESFNPANTYRR